MTLDQPTASRADSPSSLEVERVPRKWTGRGSEAVQQAQTNIEVLTMSHFTLYRGARDVGHGDVSQSIFSETSQPEPVAVVHYVQEWGPHVFVLSARVPRCLLFALHPRDTWRRFYMPQMLEYQP